MSVNRDPWLTSRGLETGRIGGGTWQSELDLMGQLTGMSQGASGPSAAESLLRRSIDQSQKAAMSSAASTRGINPVAAARVGADTGAQIAGEGASQATMLRAQEQQQATAMLQQLLGQMGQQWGQSYEATQLQPWMTETQGKYNVQAAVEGAEAGKPEWWEQLLGIPGGLAQGAGAALMMGA